jgi:type IV pilus assembly protein PilO
MKLNEPIKLPTGAFNQLNLHIAGVAALAILNVVLLVRLGFALSDLRAGSEDRIQQAQVHLAQLRIQTARLNGLPERVEQSRKDADKFYDQRIPANWSSILAELGGLASKNNVRLAGAAYNQEAAIQGLTDLRIDAHLAGDYSGIMRFINALERDKTFFSIAGVTLTGQQGGTVNLRLQLNTYLHSADASKLPQSSEPLPDDANPAAQPATAPADQSLLRPAAAGIGEGQ